ncbi:hypothetical protein AB4346_11175 [Vibrio breoganii]
MICDNLKDGGLYICRTNNKHQPYSLNTQTKFP